jgi:ATP-dependent helicase/nuclease subunit B
MGLQMLLYLFTLEKTGLEGHDLPIVPAGVLYVPAKDTMVSAKERLTDEEILEEKMKKLRRSGLLLKDDTVLAAMERGEVPEYLPVKINRDKAYAGDALATAEQLGDLSRHVEDILHQMAEELRSGSISADPWFQSESENTCAWCDYFDACHFDEKVDGWRYKSRLTAPDFWNRVACKNAEGGETPCP